MFRFFARNRLSGNRVNAFPQSTSFRISPAGRASLHAGGAVFLNVEKGVIFKANRIGSRIWQGVQNQESPAEMAARLSREYAVPENVALEDTARFLAQLEAAGFVVRNPSGPEA
jgi:coenzyme PQQ synthesis protein D (PqqD)